MRATLVTIVAALLSTAAMPKAASAQEPATERLRIRLPGGVRVELPARVQVETQGLPAEPDPAPAPADPPGVPDEEGGIGADQLPEIEPAGTGSLPPPPEPPPPPPPPPPSPSPGDRPVLARPSPSIAYRARRSYGDLQVVGARAREFFYVRQDIWFELADRDPSPLNRIRQGGNYGPHPIGGAVPVTVGSNYLVFPVCSGKIAWATRSLAMLPAGKVKARTAVSCP